MAVRNGTTANTDTLARDSSVPGFDAAYTMLVWFQIITSPGSWSSADIVEISKNQWESFYLDFLGIFNYGGVLELYHYARNNATTQELLGASELSTGTWYCAALVRASDTDRKIYLGTLTGLLAEEGALAVGVGDRSANPAGWLHVSRYRAGVIRSGNTKVWTRALTLAELQAEQFRMRPAAFTDLIAWLPFLDTGSSRGRDYAGNAALTTYGTMSDEDNPPVSFGAGILFVPRVSGTAYSQSLSGALTPAGVINKQPVKLFTGSISPAGAASKQIGKQFTGGLSPNGALSALRALLVSLSGSFSPIGGLSRQVSKTLSGTITVAGNLAKQTGKLFTGSILPNGAVTTLKSMAAVVLSGVLSFSGVVNKRTNKALAGAVNLQGGLIKQTQKILSSILDMFGSLTTWSSRPPTIQVILTLLPRTQMLSLDPRSCSLSLNARSTLLPLEDRSLTLSLTPRSTDLSLEER